MRHGQDIRGFGRHGLKQGGEFVKDEQSGRLRKRRLWMMEGPLIYVQHVEEQSQMGGCWRIAAR